jgi:hypothetical protein
VSISTTCPQCSHSLKAHDGLAGKKVKCPKCDAIIAIPKPAVAAAGVAADAPPGGKLPAGSSAPSPSPANLRKAKDAVAAAPRIAPITSDEIRSLFAGQLTLPPVSLVQKLAAPLVLLVLLVLVLGYLALIGAVAGLAFWLATSEWGVSIPPAVRWVAVGLAAVALGCLVRPLLMPQERSQRTLPLPLAQEPMLAELMAQIGKQLDAPLPNTLIVECAPGRSLDRSGRTMKLGLGLVAGLSVGQFAGFIAVLLAQHRRRAGTGPTNLVRAINGWMWRCVFREDRLDQWITRANLRPGFHLGRLLLPLRPLSYLVRMVLWVPMFIGNTIAAALVRRAELDADRCAARLIGRTAFGELQDRVKLVDYTWDGIQAELAFLYKEQRLPASLPDEVAVRLGDLSPDLAQTLLATVIKPEEIPFDSRPTDEERLEVVASEPASGIVASERPATALWSDFDKLARELTFQDYSRVFGAQHIKAAMVARR